MSTGPQVVFRLSRHLRQPGASVLAFHSVTAPDLPSSSVVNMPASECTEAIDLLRQVCEIIPLRELVARQRAGRSIRGLAAVTFDDAYASLPVLLGDYLRVTRVPITVFVTSNATAAGARFWWDRVDDLFPHVTAARWRAFEDEVGLPGAYREGQPAEFGRVRPLRQWILAGHLGRSPAALESALMRLEDETSVRTKHRAMTWDEVSAFAGDGVDIGVHTLSHPVLPLLKDAEIVREIAGGYSEIRERVPAAVPILAIPFGLFDARTVRLATEAGMHASLTLGNRLIAPDDTDAELPRLSMTRGMHPWRFLARLHGAHRRTSPRYPALPSATT